MIELAITLLALFLISWFARMHYNAKILNVINGTNYSPWYPKGFDANHHAFVWKLFFVFYWKIEENDELGEIKKKANIFSVAVIAILIALQFIIWKLS